jgi:hypothetical protein
MEPRLDIRLGDLDKKLRRLGVLVAVSVHLMRTNAVLIVWMVLAAGMFGQEIPAGTVLPVQLNSTLKAEKAKPGQSISARLMQDVPLPGGRTIRAGAKVIGHVVAVKPSTQGSGAEISLRFDALVINKKRIAILTDLRALASMMEVFEAQIPESGPDRGTSEYNWTTDQIGGEVNYHSDGAITHGSTVVGHSVPDGVLVHVSDHAGAECGATDSNHRLQAFWVFSSDACGLYGYPDVSLAHAGGTQPVGEITLSSDKRDLKIQAGSGMLLRVNRSTP